MTSFGYALSSEEHAPADLVRHARLAEEAGFEFALVSDHFHPWIDRQGHSPFVWSVLGGIATATEKLEIGTGVTCPMIRIHPAIIAQAAATTAAMMPGRFFLGVGTGENLNEHVLGDKWPDWDVRARMLEESLEVIRDLWRGEVTSFEGEFYTVENARLYTLPEQPVPIHVAASGPRAAELAGRIGDGFISTAPKPELVEAFAKGRRGKARPHYGQMTVCWGRDEKKARKTAHEFWPTAAIPGEAGQELPNPAHFEQLAEIVTEDMVAEKVICGPDVDRYVEAIEEYVEAGFDHVYIHQVGPDQEGFIEAFAKDVLPRVRSTRNATKTTSAAKR
ncbi:MAG TPA: TIGR03557 family F420-dependent LLM class oxidoreductase [Candidatus Limnocylindrales bacterium]|nr:TIGR03557 family F420-dependent LLM class oxidoreductase [Candidatus Limnocylindrales bacterium]